MQANVENLFIGRQRYSFMETRQSGFLRQTVVMKATSTTQVNNSLSTFSGMIKVLH